MSVIIQGKNARRPYTVRYHPEGRHRERSFYTLREAVAFKAEVDRLMEHLRQQRATTKLRYTGPGPVAIPVHDVIYAVYRLWDAAGGCLYVGKSAQVHPILRVMTHRYKPWWGEVATADYVTVLPEHLDQAELDQIRELNPRHNTIRRGWRS